MWTRFGAHAGAWANSDYYDAFHGLCCTSGWWRAVFPSQRRLAARGHVRHAALTTLQNGYVLDPNLYSRFPLLSEAGRPLSSSHLGILILQLRRVSTGENLLTHSLLTVSLQQQMSNMACALQEHAVCIRQN